MAHFANMLYVASGSKTARRECSETFLRKGVYVNHVTPIPDGLSSEAAAAIMCAVREFRLCTSCIYLTGPCP